MPSFPPHIVVLMENVMNAAPHRRTREYERERENKAERSKHCDKALDKSLEDTFPASDPVAVLQPLTAAPTVSPQRTLP